MITPFSYTTLFRSPGARDGRTHRRYPAGAGAWRPLARAYARTVVAPARPGTGHPVAPLDVAARFRRAQQRRILAAGTAPGGTGRPAPDGGAIAPPPPPSPHRSPPSG